MTINFDNAHDPLIPKFVKWRDSEENPVELLIRITGNYTEGEFDGRPKYETPVHVYQPYTQPDGIFSLTQNALNCLIEQAQKQGVTDYGSVVWNARVEGKGKQTTYTWTVAKDPPF